MDNLQSSIQEPLRIPPLARGFAGVAEDLVGLAAVSSVAAGDAFTRWVAITDGWIFFFLATKPLWDLTWRWRFFRIFEQGVNIQTLMGLLVLAMNVIAILNRAAWRRLPRRVLIFLTCASLSLLFSPSSMGLNELVRLLAGTLFFYTAGPLLADRHRFDRFAKTFLCVMLIPIFLAFLQVAGVLPYDYFDWTAVGEIGRASGTYPTPLSLSYFLVIGFPLAMYLADSKRQPRSTRQFGWIFMVAASLAVAFEYHRTTYVIIALQFIIWLSLTRGRRAVFWFGAILALVVILSSGWLKMLYDPLVQSASVDISSGQFLRGRGFQWFLFLDSYASAGPFHWIFGLGGSVIAGLDPDDTTIDSVEPHNDFIRVLHAYGAIGLILYLFILALLLRRIFQLLSSQDEFTRSLARTNLLILVAILIFSMMIEPLRYPAGAWYLFALGSALFCTKASETRVLDSRPE
jgi:O-antigen ligase